MFEAHLNERQSRVDWRMIAALFGLMIVGAAFIYSAKPPLETTAWYNQFHVRQMIWYALGALAAVSEPQGYNLGWNLGRIAGAGVVDHVHEHVVPRWAGDTNFMPVLAEVKVLPEHLAETRERLAAAWPR